MRFLTAVAVLAAVAWFVFVADVYRLDLDVYRIGVTTWLRGGDLYGKLPETAAGIALPFIYPPISAVVMVPMAAVPFSVASMTLTVLTIALVAVTMVLTLSSLGLSGNWLALLPVVLVLEPMRSTLDYGQINVILMVLVVADCLAGKPRWPRGALVGLAAALKLTPAAFVLFFLLRRDWKALIVAGVSFVTATSAAFLLAWDESVEFWTDAVFSTGEKVGVDYVANQSILGVLTRLDATWLWPLAAAAVTALAVLGMRRAQPAFALAVNAVAMLLVSPISWSHHWVWCLPILLAFFVHGLTTLAVTGAIVFVAAPHWWTDSLLVDTYCAYGVFALAVAAATAKTRSDVRAGRHSPLGAPTGTPAGRIREGYPYETDNTRRNEAPVELVYPPVILGCKTLFRLLDLKLDIQGAEHVPVTGGAVLACTHVSYLDFIFCGLAGLPAKRKTRFMAKQQIFANRVAGPLMRGMRHISVDRAAGQASYQQAVAALKAGEVVGVFPEATISQSFTVKAIKSGAVRMAAEAGVPVIPVTVWGSQRLWTKGRPRNLTQRHVPILIRVGEPFHPTPRDDQDVLTHDLRTRMTALLEQAQCDYPDTPKAADDRWWLPAHLGGTAPTAEEAAAGETR
jgi:alpha-1,2-mannosyltransferase